MLLIALYIFCTPLPNKWNKCLPVSLLWTMEMVIMITLELKWKHVKWERETESVLRSKPKPKQKQINQYNTYFSLAFARTSIFKPLPPIPIPKCHLPVKSQSNLWNCCAMCVIIFYIIIFAKHFCLSYALLFSSSIYIHLLLAQEFGDWEWPTQTSPYNTVHFKQCLREGDLNAISKRFNYANEIILLYICCLSGNFHLKWIG